jgi:hypothetical protein
MALQGSIRLDLKLGAELPKTDIVVRTHNLSLSLKSNALTTLSSSLTINNGQDIFERFINRSHVCRASFQGVFSCDTSPSNPRLLICNSDPSDKPGQP